MHASPLLGRIVESRQVLSLGIVPDDQVADLPFVTIDELRPHQMSEEIVELSLALRGVDSHDFGRIGFVDVDTGLIAERVLAEHRMPDIRRPLVYLLRRRVPFASPFVARFRRRYCNGRRM